MGCERMKLRTYFAIVTLLIAAVAAFAQTVPKQNAGTAQAHGAVSILNPAPGAKLKQDSVTVRYALTNPAVSASGTPSWEVRLDSRDPITTTSMDHTFTGLKPGAHTVTVQLVDANGTPVAGGTAVVNFTVLKTTAKLRGLAGAEAIAAALRLNPADIKVRNPSEPPTVANAGGALPLISVIGFGVLVGGIASAMKSR